MKIAFTVCSANYLAYAKSLADTVIQHNPGYSFVIALADTFTGLDTAFFAPHTIIPVTDMNIDALEEMNQRYTIFELSCALKPFVAGYLFQTFRDCELLFYFDSDILVYHTLHEAEEALQSDSILLTPHLSQALPSAESLPTERDLLRAGVFNAGFFGLKNDAVTGSFLHWWKERLQYHCYNNIGEGLFVDQLWLNLVPLYFQKTCVFFHPGYNLAYWNFSERTLASSGNVYRVNGDYPLVFFHFSGYDPQLPDAVTRHRTDLALSSLPQYASLFKLFGKAVARNDEKGFSSLPVTMGLEAKLANQKTGNGLVATIGSWLGRKK
ncbi:glycosyltransferase family protein [Flavisolibacter nicotianae]|uniref:glycosyl transferase n=1 Tax=Flavisolibacter nicotianae TaxID=2364882 RepID=UPI000EACC390|nr:glycosyl transferase [Flavisolibacter nicotianae]